MSIFSEIFDTVTVVANVVVNGVVVPTKCTANAPDDGSWDSAHDAIVSSEAVKTACTLDKGTERERSFRGKDKNGKKLEKFLAPKDKTGKSKSNNRLVPEATGTNGTHS